MSKGNNIDGKYDNESKNRMLDLQETVCFNYLPLGSPITKSINTNGFIIDIGNVMKQNPFAITVQRAIVIVKDMR